MAMKIPQPRNVPPGVLEAQNAAETIERELIFGMAKFYHFYRDLRETICPYDATTASYRSDFSVDHYNTLFKALDTYYRRFDQKTDVAEDFGIPNAQLATYIADWIKKGNIPEDLGDKLLSEIKHSAETIGAFTLDSLQALVAGEQFQAWIKHRVMHNTMIQLNTQKQLGQLTMENLEDAVAAARQSVSMVGNNQSDTARPIGEFQIPDEHDQNELIGPGRFLCREGFATLVGPSGIGKSTLAMQMAMSFALGKETFGFKPSRPLKILIIQGENDDGDIAEMRDGTIAGLGLSEAERDKVSASVLCCRCNSSTGKKFIQGTVRKNLQRFKPDLLIIDPALCYVGGDVKEQKVVGEFLRTFLQPELQQAQCGCLLLHHTNKPPTQNPRAGTTNEDAYAESGSAEFRNAARAAISLRSVGGARVFELRVTKRGERLGWQDELGQSTTRKYIRHSTTRNQLFWEPATEADAKAARAAVEDKKSETAAEKVLNCVPGKGEISHAKLFAEAKNLDVAEKPCRGAIKVLLDEDSIKCTPKYRSGAPAEKFYSRVTKRTIPGGT